ncbi:MAG TPA: energy transducer TonB [Gemmatimonadales bacterium]|nr:energy transducer TonB [Gemmatimonadales bacterium]
MLLGSLVSTGWHRDLWRKEMGPATLLSTVHLLAILSLRHGSPVSATPELDSEAVTYLDVPPPTEPQSPRATVQRARPLVVSQGVEIPAVKSEVEHPDKVAGFQELLAPKEIAGLPPPDPTEVAANEGDYTGRGIAGGVAGGKPPLALPPELAASLALEGRTSDVLTASSRPPIRPIEVQDVLVKPQLLNRREIYDLLLNRYPASLRDLGVEGSVVVEFVVDTTGLVDPGSASIVSSSHELFAGAALELVKRARFSPGRTTIDGKMETVPVLVRVPLRWSLQK